jgi:N-acetylmuramoyl-L-alanine amidase
MPAVLVEVGFLSNPEEEARLRSSSYRDSIAQAMARAVSGFLAELERLSRPVLGGGGAGASRP